MSQSRNKQLKMLLLLLASLAGFVSSPLAAEQDGTAMQHAKKHMQAQYVCPMHARVVSSSPGDCPVCGMPLEATEAAGEQSRVSVSAAMQHSFGVTLAHVERGKAAQEVYASGFVEKVSPARTLDISSRVDAPVSRILVEPGQWVQQDEALLTMDYPPYQDTLKRYLKAMEQARIDDALPLRDALIAMGVSDAVLAGFDEEQPLSDKLEIVAPFAGEVVWVTDKPEAGKGEPVLTLRSPSLAEADLRSYSRIARGVKVGHEGRLHVAHLPGRSWPGRVVEVIHNRAGFYSTLRFHVEVPGDALEPGAFAGAYIDAGSRQQVLRIPADAVIYDENQTRVVRWLGDDQFEVVNVELGFEGHEWVEVRAGLQLGDHVVTRAQFLIDSEATLKAGLRRLQQAAPHQD